MLITVANPVGIDAIIKKAQTHLHNKLVVLWGIEPEQYRAYGRCHRNRKGDGYVAEWYEGNNEYRDVYFDDRLAAVSFFGTGAREDRENGFRINVHLVFFVNLEALKPGIPHRADEEVRLDVKNLIGKNLFGLEQVSCETWLENCLREYPDTVKRLRAEPKFDMHPNHCFRINLVALYTNKNC